MNRREMFRRLGGVAVAAVAAPVVAAAREASLIEQEPTVHHHTHLSNVTVHGPLTVRGHHFEMRDSTIMCDNGTAVQVYPENELWGWIDSSSAFASGE